MSEDKKRSNVSIEEGKAFNEKLVKLLVEKKLTITTAESCTGGLISAAITDVPGASAVFKQGFVTYSNKVKRRALGVKKTTLDECGAVSKKVAKQMAIGAAMQANADIAIAVTGIAGPDGGSEEKPVGLVYICCYIDGKANVEEFIFSGNRSEIRQQTVVNALAMAIDAL